MLSNTQEFVVLWVSTEFRHGARRPRRQTRI
jgi:hypothetical protein